MTGSQYTVRRAPGPPKGGKVPLFELAQHTLRTGQPVAHPHAAVHRHREGEVLARPVAPAGAREKAAEAEVAVRHERAHPELLGQRERLAVVRLAALCIETVGMGRD